MTQKLELGTNKYGKVYQIRNESDNHHILVTGSTGCGKSVALNHLATNLGLANEQVIIFDYAKSSINSMFNRIALNELPAIKSTFSLNQNICSDSDCISQYVGMVVSSWHFGSRQRALLFHAFSKMHTLPHDFVACTDNPYAKYLRFNGAKNVCKDFSLLSYLLYEIDTSTAADLAGRFWDIILQIYQTSLGNIEYSDSSPLVVHYPDVSNDLVISMTELCLWNIYCQRRYAKKTSFPPVNIILDEFQNLNWSKGSIMTQLLTEGRRFGINLILATQYMNLDVSKSARSALHQANLHLIFSPPSCELQSVARTLPHLGIRERVNQLANLNTGKCLAYGNLAYGNMASQKQILEVTIPYSLER